MFSQIKFNSRLHHHSLHVTIILQYSIYFSTILCLYQVASCIGKPHIILWLIVPSSAAWRRQCICASRTLLKTSQANNNHVSPILCYPQWAYGMMIHIELRLFCRRHRRRVFSCLIFFIGNERTIYRKIRITCVQCNRFDFTWSVSLLLFINKSVSSVSCGINLQW